MLSFSVLIDAFMHCFLKYLVLQFIRLTISPINTQKRFHFIFQNKFYIETKLNRDLKDDLIKLFTEHVAEKHIYSLMRK